jgi:hypothetical protein
MSRKSVQSYSKPLRFCDLRWCHLGGDYVAGIQGIRVS